VIREAIRVLSDTGREIAASFVRAPLPDVAVRGVVTGRAAITGSIYNAKRRRCNFTDYAIA
jgi:hypothetical protein